MEYVSTTVAGKVMEMETCPPETPLHPVCGRAMVHERCDVRTHVTVTSYGEEGSLRLRIGIEVPSELTCKRGVLLSENRGQFLDRTRVSKDHIGVACKDDVGAGVDRHTPFHVGQVSHPEPESPGVGREASVLEQVRALDASSELTKEWKTAIAGVVVDDDETMDPTDFCLLGERDQHQLEVVGRRKIHRHQREAGVSVKGWDDAPRTELPAA
jgi:hypothetical protein